MRHRLLTAVVLALVCALPASAQTVDEIIAKNIEAKGGLDRLAAIKTLRMTGTMTVGPGVEAPFVMEFKRPNQMRMDITVQGMTVTQAFNGKAGWMVNPMTGRTEAESVPPEALKMMEEQADFDGPLVDYAAKGHAVQLVGKAQVGDAGTYQLRITFKNGDVRHYYLDAARYLEVRVEGKATVRGSEMETEGIIGDYREVAGVMFPHSMESAPKGSPQKQKMTVTKVEVNPEIDDSRFQMPGK